MASGGFPLGGGPDTKGLSLLALALLTSTTAQRMCGSGYANRTIQVPVAAEGGDVFQYKRGDGITFVGTLGEVYAGRSSQGNVRSALRFPGVPLPREAMVMEAKARLVDGHAGTVCCQGMDLRIFVQLEYSADSMPLPAHSTAGWLLSSLPVTQAQHWLPEPTRTYGRVETPELAEMLQAVVDLEGWTAGNSVTLILDGEGETEDVDERVYFGSGGEESQHAMLVITYCAAVADDSQETTPFPSTLAPGETTPFPSTLSPGETTPFLPEASTPTPGGGGQDNDPDCPQVQGCQDCGEGSPSPPAARAAMGGTAAITMLGGSREEDPDEVGDDSARFSAAVAAAADGGHATFVDLPAAKVVGLATALVGFVVLAAAAGWRTQGEEGARSPQRFVAPAVDGADGL